VVFLGLGMDFAGFGVDFSGLPRDSGSVFEKPGFPGFRIRVSEFEVRGLGPRGGGPEGDEAFLDFALLAERLRMPPVLLGLQMSTLHFRVRPQMSAVDLRIRLQMSTSGFRIWGFGPLSSKLGIFRVSVSGSGVRI